MAPNNYLNEIGVWLAADGLGLVANSNLFAGHLPEGTTLVVALLPYVGPPSEHDLGAGAIRYEFPRFQVVAAGPSYALTLLMLQKIAASFAKIANQTLTATYYLSIMPVGSVSQQDRDKNNRWVLVQSFEAQKAPSPTA